MTANEYMSGIYAACGDKLMTEGLYSGKEGHLRLAREIGVALHDFDPKEQHDILLASYSCIYVRACFLRPVLDAKEWIKEMLKGKEKSASLFKYKNQDIEE